MFLSLASAFALCSFIVGSNGEPLWSFANLTSGDQFCPEGYSLVGSQCLMFVTFALENHREAKQTCHSVSGELLAITTPTQFVHVVNHIHAYGYTGRQFWLDGSDAEKEGNWVTSSGQAVPRGTPFWAAFQDTQQPDNAHGAEHCLEMESSEFFYLNDAVCEDKSNFICQYNPQKQDKRDLTPTTQVPKAAHLEGYSSQCPTFYVEVGGLCLMFVTWAVETWHEAQQTCGDSSDLLAITDAEVLRAVYLYLHQENIADHSFWLGGSDSAEGNWVYTTGEAVPMGTPFWGLYNEVQEPQGGTKENCLMLHSPGSHYFRDISCSSRLNPLCVYHG
ncbi:macrophage mannose receptor 1-like [Penaeus chinensis]|uniref:macrophage mannose receptor 1-like n=1 Tax=Penaeus chinensis TaxID=139456 RepID=UPI001FB6A432|nr:macrophage mannose receptor 1-like [Penaeus chinensis]